MSLRRFGSYTVEIKREDKVLFPGEEITKGDLLEYYETVSSAMLPHLADRPLTLQRFPDGVDEEGFFQKSVPDHFPDWISTVRVPLSDGGSQTQVMAGNQATLVYLANQAAITPHMWLSRKDDLSTPDRLVFDLDPAGEDYAPVKEGARRLREMMEAVGLAAFFMTTGGSGGHVWCPIRREAGFQEVRDFAEAVADFLAGEDPETFTREVRKEKRNGRLYLDVGRNAYGQTAVAPYSVRARPGAPVATPLEWDELEDPNLSGRRYTLQSLPERMTSKEDPWKGMGRRAGSLKRARREWRKWKEKGEN